MTDSGDIPGVLSDVNFLMIAVIEPEFAASLAGEFGEDANSLTMALLSGADHLLRDRALNLFSDVLGNCSTVLSAFTAKESKGRYPIEVIGFENVCLIRAPEFDTVGPFASVIDAEDYVISNWMDTLVSIEPGRTPPRFIVTVAAQPLPLRRRLPKIKIGGRTVAKHDEGSYTLLRSSLLNSDKHFDAAGLATHLAKEPLGASTNEIRVQLKRAKWRTVLTQYDQVVEANFQRRKTENLDAEAEILARFKPFVDKWLEVNSGGLPVEQGAVYEAVRAWMASSSEPGAASLAAGSEDGPSPRHLHYRAQMLCSLYLNSFHPPLS